MEWGGLIASLTGGIAGNFMQAENTRSANQANYRIAREAMDFQRDMSNSAHQREMIDLKAAGLNPNLAAGGNGASTPAGQTATMQAAPVYMPDLLPAMSLALDKQKVDNDTQRVQNEQASNAAQIAKNLSETDLNKMKKILAQKGMVAAELEGEASDVIRNIIQWGKKKYKNFNMPAMPDIKGNWDKLQQSQP